MLTAPQSLVTDILMEVEVMVTLTEVTDALMAGTTAIPTEVMVIPTATTTVKVTHIKALPLLTSESSSGLFFSR